jgi:hypothetical protein
MEKTSGLMKTPRVRIVYRELGRTFVVHKNRDLEGNPPNL